MTPMTFAASLGLAFSISALTAQERLPEPTKEPAHNVFLLTGCLERGNAPTAFRLTRASAIGQAPPRLATPDKDEGIYDLQAKSSVSEEGLSGEKLMADVGTRVEVTIRPVEAAAAVPPSPARQEPSPKPTESPRQRYTVVKLNRLADSCAQP